MPAFLRRLLGRVVRRAPTCVACDEPLYPGRTALCGRCDAALSDWLDEHDAEGPPLFIG